MTLICDTRREADASCPWSVLGPSLSLLASSARPSVKGAAGPGRQVALPADGWERGGVCGRRLLAPELQLLPLDTCAKRAVRTTSSHGASLGLRFPFPRPQRTHLLWAAGGHVSSEGCDPDGRSPEP